MFIHYLRIALRVCLLGCLFMLVACAEQNASTPLRIGTNSWIGYEPLYLLQHAQLAPELNLDLQRMNNNTEVMAAFERGDIAAAGLTLDEVMLLLARQVPLRIASILDISDGADKLLARPEIDTLQQLKGRTIAVENTAVGALLLHSALAAAGITERDVNVLPSTVEQHYELYLSGKVDAVVTFAPYATTLQNRGARLLYDSSQMNDAKIIDVLIVNPDVAMQRKAELDLLLKALQTAMKLLVEQDSDALAFTGKNQNLPPAEWPNMLDGLLLGNGRFHHQNLKNGTLENAMRVLDKVMVQQGLLKSSLQDKIQPSLFLY